MCHRWIIRIDMNVKKLACVKFYIHLKITFTQTILQKEWEFRCSGDTNSYVMYEKRININQIISENILQIGFIIFLHESIIIGWSFLLAVEPIGSHARISLRCSCRGWTVVSVHSGIWKKYIFKILNSWTFILILLRFCCLKTSRDSSQCIQTLAPIKIGGPERSISSSLW